MHERIWFLKNCDLLVELDANRLSELERRCRMRTFPAGSPIYLPTEASDSVFLVALGLVKLGHLTAEGKLSTLAFVQSNELFGELSLLDSGRRDEYAETATASTLIRIPRDALRSLMHTDLDIALRLTRLVGLRRQRAERRLRSLLFNSNRQRLCHLLLDLADQFGVSVNGGIRLGLKLSHQEIASLIGTTRETVTISLGKLKAEGLVGGHRQNVVLPDVVRLAALVDRPAGRGGY